MHNFKNTESWEDKASNKLSQRGPTTFVLWAILQKRDNSRATSNKIMYKTTNSQQLKLKRKMSECVIEIITQ